MKLIDKLTTVAVIILTSILLAILINMSTDKEVEPHSCSFCEHNVSEEG